MPTSDHAEALANAVEALLDDARLSGGGRMGASTWYEVDDVEPLRAALAAYRAAQEDEWLPAGVREDFGALAMSVASLPNSDHRKAALAYIVRLRERLGIPPERRPLRVPESPEEE